MKIHWRPSPNFDARPEGVQPDMLVLHYTGMESGEAALNRLCDPAAKVSAHYQVMEDGTIYHMVKEDSRAWHAGVSHWRGRDNINHYSIGIEIVNPGHEFGYQDFPEGQMQSVEALCLDICSRYPIPAINVVGHSDIAVDRKMDPGEKFDWGRLAGKGVGFVVGAEVGIGVEYSNLAPISVDNKRFDAACALLGDLGYAFDPAKASERKAVLCAFQRHWRQQAVTGVLDEGTMAALEQLHALIEKEDD